MKKTAYYIIGSVFIVPLGLLGLSARLMTEFTLILARTVSTGWELGGFLYDLMKDDILTEVKESK